MRTVTLLFVAATLAFTVSAEAKPNKKNAKAEKPVSAKDKFKPVGGPLPPLPQATALSLAFDVPDDETFAMDASAASAKVSEATAAVAWTIGEWRKQLAADRYRIAQYRNWLADQLEKAQRDDFTVAVRYLQTVYATATQFASLSAQTATEFESVFPPDRNNEPSITPPVQARRVRLYRDKLEVLYAASRSFLARSVQGRQEKIVRIE